MLGDGNTKINHDTLGLLLENASAGFIYIVVFFSKYTFIWISLPLLVFVFFFKNTSIKVKYLTKSPLPTVTEDWFEARYVQRLFPKKEIKDYVKNELLTGKVLEEEVKQGILSLPDEKLFELIRQSFMELDNAGVLIPGIEAEAQKKKNEKYLD